DQGPAMSQFDGTAGRFPIFRSSEESCLRLRFGQSTAIQADDVLVNMAGYSHRNLSLPRAIIALNEHSRSRGRRLPQRLTQLFHRLAFPQKHRQSVKSSLSIGKLPEAPPAQRMFRSADSQVQ